MTADRDRIWRAILEIGTCMLVTRDGNDLRARPMQALAEPDENAVWFLSDRNTHKDGEVRADPNTCLAFADVDEDLYVSLSGRLEVIDDSERVATLLSEDEDLDEDDKQAAEELIALRFTPDTGEIWDGWSLAEEEEDDETEEAGPETQSGAKISFGGDDGGGRS